SFELKIVRPGEEIHPLPRYQTKNNGIGEEVTKFTSKLGIPGVSAAAGLLSFGADRMKDLNLDMKLSGFATDIGDLKNGLNGANAKIDAQGKALRGAIDGVKSELEGALKQQGEKFDKEIKDLDKKQKQELESKIQEVTEQLTKAQDQLKQELADFKSEVNERFAEQEQKILENKRKIEEEKRQREAEIRE
ncbi:14039_t:CDS:2, partial [Gigaspora margarita]